MTTNKLHTLADVASALGCSVATVKRRVADGTIPVIRIGPRTMRVNEATLANLVQPVSLSQTPRAT
jgi:excisionase family DNA binding protein